MGSSTRPGRRTTSPKASAANARGCNVNNRWTVLNILGLILNLSLMGFTLVLYHRMIAATTTEGTNCLKEEREQYPQLPAKSTTTTSTTRLQLPTPKEDDTPDGKEQAPKEEEDPDKEFHIIFSTGCSPKQNWQAYVLYHSIMESGQVGHVTRIASGCSPAQAEALKQIHHVQIDPMGKVDRQKSRFHLHLTPEFGFPPGQTKGKSFMYMNKPYGCAHWMEEVLGYGASKTSVPIHDDTIIVLLDPDMVVLRPFVNDFSKNEIWRTRTTYPCVTSIQHGFPMSQEYGFGNWWHRGVKNVSTILPANELPSPAQTMTKPQINENYTAGPPYLATARDFYKLVTKWRQISWPVQREFPDTILAEMFAYSWAAAHLNLPHQQAHSFMVSAHFEEGFHLLKPISSEQMCRGDIPITNKPHVLHYCQRYAIGKYILGKHKLPQTFVGTQNVAQTCQSPLLVEPPTNVSTLYNYFIEPGDGKRTPMTAAKNGMFTEQEHRDRITFMLCEMIAALNRAATYFKQQHCTTANYEKTLFFHKSLD